MENQQDTFNQLRKEIKSGNPDVIHFIMTQARNISAYVIRNTKQSGDSIE